MSAIKTVFSFKWWSVIPFWYMCLIVDTTESSKHSGLCVRAYFTFLWSFGFGNWIRSNISLSQTNPPFLCTTQIDSLFSNQRISFSYGSVRGTKPRAEAIFGHIMRLYPFDSCVILCGFHDDRVRPPIKPTSAVISSPKSFVIALICILQLSVLAHSKNNQPPLKTGDSIIIISVDLYKTLLTSLCLTSALCRQASFATYFRKMYIYHGQWWLMHRRPVRCCH